MSVPGIVQSALDGEEIAARVSIGGEDELFVTSQRTIIYRADGLLSDESIDEFEHGADRITLSEGRRKTKFSLEYPLDGVREFTVPASKTEAVLHPVLAGVLNGNGITDAGESVVKAYRFSELTLIITSARLVKHIGEAVWDGDFEQYHFDDVTNLSFEDGSIATQIVIEVDGRPHRIKAPNDDAGDVSERLKRSLFAYHDVTSLEELNDAVGVDEDDDADRDDPASAFGDGVDPLDAETPEPDDTTDTSADSDTTRERDPLETASHSGRSSTATITSGSGSTSPSSSGQSSAAVAEDRTASAATNGTRGDEPDGVEESDLDPATTTDAELLERLESLEEAVTEQNTLLSQQQETIEQLITELRQGR